MADMRDVRGTGGMRERGVGADMVSLGIDGPRGIAWDPSRVGGLAGKLPGPPGTR